MADSKGTFYASSPLSSPFNLLTPPWQYELFDKNAIDAFARIRKTINSGFALFSTTTTPTWLCADLSTVHAATTAHEAKISRLALQQEDLQQESEMELRMKEMLEIEAKRLQECLAIHRREIMNIGLREEARQYQLAELKDLGLVMLVQAPRDKTPEHSESAQGNGNEGPG